jgi:hypothetical protein
MSDTRVPSKGLAELRALVDRLGRAPALSSPAPVPLSRTVSPPPLKAVSAFQGTWSRLRAEQRLRQVLAHVPASAGPLNSSHLVNRALQAINDVSPEYLDAFMSHIDTLQWLEQTVEAADPVPRKAAARAPRKT